MTSGINNQDTVKLVKKYDRPGPRYTSYPTVPNWTDEYGPDKFIETLKVASNKSDQPLSLYLHIPFCKKRCWFCGCTTTVSPTTEPADRYLDALNKEISLVSPHLNNRKSVSQLHWGGGTPSTLTDSQTEDYFAAISDSFNITEDAEISIELDPRTTTENRLKLLSDLGFNRLSFGIQDFNSNVQTAIGRNQSEKQAVDLYNTARKLGFGRINFDLIYGLPGQDESGFTKTIEKVINLKPDRIALYSFAYLPQLKKHQGRIDKALIPDAEIKLQLFLVARSQFIENGYCQIGMDHFVLPDDELSLARDKGLLRRNFMGYTVNSAEDWLGIGMSAISYINESFAQNISTLSKYYESIDSRQSAVFRGLSLSDDDLIRQAVISDIMCNFRIDYETFSRRFDITFDKYFTEEIKQLEQFLNDGLIARDANHIEITETGQLFVRNIAMIFDAYLKDNQSNKLGPSYSRTV